MESETGVQLDFAEAARNTHFCFHVEHFFTFTLTLCVGVCVRERDELASRERNQRLQRACGEKGVPFSCLILDKIA